MERAIEIGKVGFANRSMAFTLIEMLIVLAMLALLLTLVTPRFFAGLERAKEAALREDLHRMRGLIEKFYEDTGRYPESLQELVDRKYLRSIPMDPVSEKADSWVIVAPADPRKGAVFDVKSGAEGNGVDGTLYSTW